MQHRRRSPNAGPAQWKELYDRGHRLRALHRLRRLRHRLPARRHRLRPRTRAATSRSTSRRSSAPTTASTARRAAPRCTRACPRFRVWEPAGRRAPLRPHPRARRDRRHLPGHPAHPRRGRPRCTRWARTAGWCRRSSSGRMEHDYIDAALVSYLEGGATARGRRSPAWPRTRSEILATAGSRYTYSANTLALDEALEAGPRTPRARRHELPVVGAAGDVEPQDRQDLASRSCSTSGCCARRRFDDAIFDELFLAKYGLAQGGHGQDEHQGRVPDLDAATAATTRSTSRSATPGRARAATTAPTSRPSTPTSPAAASARTTTGPSPSSAPTWAARSSPG